MAYACIDIGSNTTRLLVAESVDGQLRELLQQRAFTRIAKGRKREEYRRDIDIKVVADDLIVDHIVPPSQLRREVLARLEAYADKHHPLPKKGHGTVI